jgi:hypothetical protein
MAHADWIIDLGPGAGHDGGRIVFEGTPADLVAARSTITGQHLADYVGGTGRPKPARRKSSRRGWVALAGSARADGMVIAVSGTGSECGRTSVPRMAISDRAAAGEPGTSAFRPRWGPTHR